jgi:hypothetical protein
MIVHLDANSEGFLPSVEMTWLAHPFIDPFGARKIAFFSK